MIDRPSRFFVFFYEVGRASREQNEVNVEKYAFQNSRFSFVNADEWSGLQSHIINAYRRNSSLISFIVEIFILREVEHGDVDRVNLAGFLERRIPELAQENRTGEIIWLFILIIRLGLSVPSDRLTPLFQIENSMVALLVTYANHRGLVQGAVNHGIWQRHLTSQGLRSPMWLYAYESVRNGTNPNLDRTFIEQDPFFSLLLRRDIQFFDPSRGFESIGATLRGRRAENARANVLRQDFLDDFDIELLEFDADDMIDEPDVELDDDY